MKKIYVFLLSLFCLLSLAIPMHGETATLNCPAGTISNNAMSWDMTPCTIVHSKESSSNFASYAPWRIYQYNKVVFTPKSGIKITKIEITATTIAYATAGAKTWTNATATASSTILTVTPTDGTKEISLVASAQTRWSLLTITYEAMQTTEYDVTWSVGGTTSVTKTQGGKAVLPAEPAGDAIGACADTFVGWSTSNLGSVAGQSAPDVLFTTAADAPAITKNTTFYAVFAKAEEGEGTSSSTTLTYGWESSETYADKFTQNFINTNTTITAYEGSKYGINPQNGAGNKYSIQTKEKYAVTSVKFRYSKITTNTTAQTWLLLTSTDGNSWTQHSTTFSASGATKGEWSEASWSLDGSEVYVKITMGSSGTAQRTIDDLQITYSGISSGITYSDYVTDCVDCTQEGADCPEYPVVLNDRGILDTVATYWVGKEITEDEIANAYTPQGGCKGYTFAGWTTEEGLSNLTATEWESKMVKFPIKMTAKAAAEGQLTLYAVYSSELTDEYRLVTAKSELTTGEYVITAAGAGAKEYALSFVRKDYIENFGSQEVEITTNEAGNEIVSTTNPEIIWTLTATADGNYTLEALHFEGMEKKSYLNIVSNYLQFEETAKPYTISEGDTYAAFTLCSPDGYCLSYNGQDFVADETASPLYLYKRVKETRYSTSTACDPSIISVGTVAVTSAPGIWVEAVTQPYIFAERLQSNRDGAKSVDIIATSKTEQFTLKPVGATGEGSASLTLKIGETRDNFADRFMVVYRPKGYDVIDEGEIVVKAVNHDNPSKEYAVHTIRVKGRSLPEHFVIAAQTEKGWVALPADLGTSSLAVLKAPYRIEVDNEADPTKATQAPKTALYHAAARFEENTNPRGVHLMNGSGMRLCGDYSKEPDQRLWFANGAVPNSQSWALRSLALKDYYIRLQAAPAGNYLFYNATTGGGKIGYYEYKQENRLRLRLLPVAATCVRYDAPEVQVAKLQSESVTLEWRDVQSGVGYEYSLDGGTKWTPFGTEHGWEVKSGVNTATISGLTPEKDYTVSVRAAVGEGQDNCSEECTRTFTMPLCDDVPHHLWATATADSVTIVWEAKAAKATVILYSDEAGTNTVAEDTGAESPHSIKGLTQNTKYWYQVFAGDKGTCASAIASFTTESNDISIVEWEKEAVIVDINTEVADGVDILVQKRSESSDGNVADDLFFSKYFEAASNVKLLAIYNGTKEDMDVSNVRIHIIRQSRTTDPNDPEGTQKTEFPCEHFVPLSKYVSDKVIRIAQEVVLYSYQPSATNGRDLKILDCIQKKEGFETWIPIPYTYSETAEALVFGGQDAILLERQDEQSGEWKPIDLIGAVNATYSDVVTTACSQPTWGDGKGWSCTDGKDLEGNPLALSTNRCLLIRDKDAHVVSGKNAVEQNIDDFKTLCTEWKGRHVQFYRNDYTTDNNESCNGFSSVAGFDYNKYYITYDKIDEAVFSGTPNANGTYTISVPSLLELACNDIRLQLTKNGEVTASVEQKVPIIVDKTTDTKDETYFPTSLTDEICSTCDVVVRGEQKLTHNTGARKFRNMYIYHGSRLEIDPDAAIQLEKLRMFALNDDVSYAIINNSAKEGEGSTPSIYVKEISHVKRIDGQYWYPFSLPYNCYIKDISALNGRELGEYGMDWGIKYYDGQKRQAAGKSAAAGQTSDFWYMMPADGMLEAYKGYIIGLFTGDEMHQKSINFAPANINTYTETAESKTTYVENWTDNLEAAARHHGWNFTGSPYISLFGSNVDGQGLNNAKLQMGRTNPETGEQEKTDWVYVSIPNGADSRTYTQQLASATQVKPFSAYFVQAIDPAKGASKGESISLTYSKTNRSLPEQAANPTLAPRRSSSRDEVLFAELVLRASAHSASGMSDNAGVLVSNRFSTEYEIGYDLTKMYAAADKPQLYTLASDNEKMAYNAVPDLWGQHVPLGIYVPSAGDYTLSLNPSASRLEHAESVLLLYNGGIAANLLTGDYTLSAAGKGSVSGYSLDIRRSREIATDTEASAVGMTGVGVQNGELVLLNLPGDADVAVYDMLGRVLLSTRTTGDTPQISVPDLPTGIYTAVVTTAENQQIFKTMLR